LSLLCPRCRRTPLPRQSEIGGRLDQLPRLMQATFELFVPKTSRYSPRLGELKRYSTLYSVLNMQQSCAAAVAPNATAASRRLDDCTQMCRFVQINVYIHGKVYLPLDRCTLTYSSIVEDTMGYQGAPILVEYFLPPTVVINNNRHALDFRCLLATARYPVVCHKHKAQAPHHGSWSYKPSWPSLASLDRRRKVGEPSPYQYQSV
jgi:hypothetical protein